MSHWLILLAIVPLSCLKLTKILQSKHRWMWCGVAFGLVIAPLSYGLLSLTYVPIIGKFLGLIGLLANLTHGSVGYICLMGSGLIEPNTVLSVFQLIAVNIVNGLLFSYTYGALGHAVDKKLEEVAIEPIDAIDAEVIGLA